MLDFDPGQYVEDDRQEVNPPIEVELATWSPGGTLDVGQRAVMGVRTLGGSDPWQ